MLKFIFLLTLFLSYNYHAICFDKDDNLQNNPQTFNQPSPLGELVTNLCIIGGTCYLSHTITLGKSLSMGFLELCQNIYPDEACLSLMKTLPYLPTCITITGAAAAAALIISHTCKVLHTDTEQNDNAEIP